MLLLPKGNLVNFKNCIIVFTSNIGSDKILESAGDPSREVEMRSKVMEAMKKKFRPEFLNRLDEFVIFNSLGTEQLRSIVQLELAKLQLRLDARRIRVDATPEALDFIADIGYDAVYGARPLKRTISREVETPLARFLLAGNASDGDTVVLDIVNDRLKLTVSQVADASVVADSGLA